MNTLASAKITCHVKKHAKGGECEREERLLLVYLFVLFSYFYNHFLFLGIS